MQDTDINKQSTVGHHCPINKRVGLAMNLPPDRYHTKAKLNTKLEEKKRELINFQLAGDT